MGKSTKETHIRHSDTKTKSIKTQNWKQKYMSKRPVRFPNKAVWDKKKNLQITTEFVLCWLVTAECLLLDFYCWVEGLPLNVVYISVRLHCKNWFVSFASSCQLEIASWLGMGDNARFSCLSPETLSSLYRSCACHPRLCELIGRSVLVCLEGIVSVMSYIPSGSFHHLSSTIYTFHRILPQSCIEWLWC